MQKDKLLRKLKQARNTEEAIISVTGARVKSVVIRSGLAKEKIREIRTLMQKIIDDSKRHRALIDSLIRRVEKEEKDDY